MTLNVLADGLCHAAIADNVGGIIVMVIGAPVDVITELHLVRLAIRNGDRAISACLEI